MKITRVIACVTIFAVLQIMPIGGSLSNQLDAVNAQITVVEGLMGKLRGRQYVDQIAEAIDGIAGMEQNFTSILDLICGYKLERIQDLLENYTAEGRDATACQAAVRSAYQTLQTNTRTEFAKCFESMRGSLNTTAGAVESKMQEAIQVLSNLNLIFPSCYTTNTADIESCIVETLPNVTKMVETLNTNALAFMTNGGSNKTSGEQIATCFDGGARLSDDGCEALEIDFENCVKTL